MTRLIARLTTVALSAAALAGLTAVASSATATSAKVKTGTSSLGTILVDGKSHTLYLFEKDKNGKSACSGACAAEWPPLLTKGKPTVAAGAKAALLGTIKRADGSTQVTYNKHPLYTFVADKGKRGSHKGEGLNDFGGRWYVVTAKGTAKRGGY
jgi:predicted lipoprotein with Yx(FWY)xxD motif